MLRSHRLISTTAFALIAACSSPERRYGGVDAGGSTSASGGGAAGASATSGGSGGDGGGGGVPDGGRGAAAGASGASGGGAAGGAGMAPGGAGMSTAGGGSGGSSGAAGSAGSGGAAGSAGGGAAGTAGGGAAGTAGSGAAGAAGSAGGTPEDCTALDRRCVAAAPPGWEGPFLVTPEAADSCPSEFPVELPELHAGLQSSSGSCACDCGTPDVDCGGTITRVWHQSSNCSVGVAGGSISEGCHGASNSASLEYKGEASASCGSATVQPQFADPEWETSLRRCGGATHLGHCEGEDALCVAAPQPPFDSKYCVADAGEETCPSSYPIRTLVHSAYDDRRTCPMSCSCSASGYSCRLQVDVYSRSGCSGDSSSRTVSPGGGYVCVIGNTSTQMSFDVAMEVSNAGQCTPDASLPVTGAVVETGTTTICCTE